MGNLYRILSRYIILSSKQGLDRNKNKDKDP